MCFLLNLLKYMDMLSNCCLKRAMVTTTTLTDNVLTQTVIKLICVLLNSLKTQVPCYQLFFLGKGDGDGDDFGGQGLNEKMLFSCDFGVA